MREANVIVTTLRDSTSVRLPVGVLVDLSCATAKGQRVSMLWCPPSESKSDNEHGVTPVIDQSRTETAAEVKVSLEEVAPVEGVFLRQWGSEGEGEGEFDSPKGVCVNGEEVFICDEENNRIQVFARDGSFVRQWGGTRGIGQGELDSPHGITVSEGEVFVCDWGNDMVQVFGVDGSFVRQWGSRGSGQGEFNHLIGVAVSNGEVLVSDLLNHRIQVFDVAGTFLRQWGEEGSGDGQFNHPRGLAVRGGVRV
jgi:hypothetical protein